VLFEILIPEFTLEMRCVEFAEIRMLKFQSNAEFVKIGLFGVGSSVEFYY